MAATPIRPTTVATPTPNNGGNTNPPNNGGNANQPADVSVTRDGDKLTLTIKEDVIDIQALRDAGSIDGKPVYDSTIANSYRNFVVSGEKNSEGQSYKSQVFGYVYNKNNGTDKGTRRSNAFSAGEVTAPDDPILASNNQFT